MPSTIEVEKFERESGIYMIFNKDTDWVYVGQAKDLKARMIQHIQILFEDKENKDKNILPKNQKQFRQDNKNLQDDFNKDTDSFRMVLLEQVSVEELDKYESLYLQAAEKKYKVYNIKELKKYKADTSEIEKAKEIIEQAKQRNTPGMYNFKTRADARQDWISKSNSEIIEEVRQRVRKDGEPKLKKEPELGSISLRELYENGKLDHLMLGVVGDYVGTQTITDILIEKMADISLYGKCLWVGGGPGVGEFKAFKEKHGFGEEKKLYILFHFTLNKFKSSAQDQTREAKCSWEDKDGTVLSATAPSKVNSKNTPTYKALLIDKIWTVEEDFPIYRLLNYYYRYAKPAYYKSEGKNKLNNDLSHYDRQMKNTVSRKAILNSEELQRELQIEGELLEEFKAKAAGQTYSSFIPCNEDGHPVRYVLMEVLDYVKIKEDEN